MPRLALYQPDIPQNTGALMRLCACLAVPLDIIEPCGFALSDARLKRAGMDYRDRAMVTQYTSWDAFLAAGLGKGRLVLLTTQGTLSHLAFPWQANDVLVLGRESCGVPQAVHDRADARLRIPMVEGARSLNLALAGAMALGEALRQTGGWPEPAPQPAPPGPAPEGGGA